MSRRTIKTEEQLREYADKIAHFRREFLRRSKIIDIVDRPAVTFDASALRIWNNGTVQSFPAAPRQEKIQIKKEFYAEVYPMFDEAALISQLDVFKTRILADYQLRVPEPCPEIPSHIITKAGRVRDEIFAIWTDCLRIYDEREETPTPPFVSIGRKEFPKKNLKTAENKAAYYYRKAVEYIKQAENGVFPSPLK